MVDAREVDQVSQRGLERSGGIEPRRVGAERNMSAGKRKGIRLEEVSNPARHGEPGGSHAADQRQRRHRLLERTVLNAAPEFLESGHTVRCIVAGYEARVDGSDRGTDHPVRLDAGFMQSLVDANLVGTERAATLQHQHDLAETGRQRDAVGVRPSGCGFVEREGPCACHRMSPVGDAVARTSFTLPDSGARDATGTGSARLQANAGERCHALITERSGPVQKASRG